MNEFYVYVYLDPRKPGNYEYESICFLYEPFYIGKGKGKRCYDHITNITDNDRNTIKVGKIKNILSEGVSPIILKHSQNIIESDAFVIEKKLISEIGTIAIINGIKRGCLSNMTAGGEGTSGFTFKMSEEHKERLREGIRNSEMRKKSDKANGLARRGIPLSEETKQKIKDTIATSEARKLGAIKAGETQRGKKLTEEHKQKISQGCTGKIPSRESIDKSTNSRIANGTTGRSEECRKKISEVLCSKNIKQSDETKQKRAQTMKDKGFNYKTAAKTWLIKNVLTSEIHVVLDFKDWCESHQLSCYYISKTYKTGVEHKKQPGWLVIDKFKTQK